jgi:hypothetical protein
MAPPVAPQRGPNMPLRLSEVKYLTAEEVAERYRGAVSVGTLRNWRTLRIGPPFVKIGKAVLYPAAGLDAWDQANMVQTTSTKATSKDDAKG